MKNVNEMSNKEILLLCGLVKFETMSDFGYDSVEVRGWDNKNSFCIRLVKKDLAVFDWDMDFCTYMPLAFNPPVIAGMAKDDFSKTCMPKFYGDNITSLEIHQTK